ncbi:MAG TPA: hypothetical protein VES88_09350 [Gemmatimonadaceae bacterium]|nr:hypothetical protein [Gemmatimonadaceae bacterium]
MNDAYLLLTPILMLLVVGLVGFVGCDLLFGLDEVPTPADAPTGFQATAGNRRVDLMWDAYAGASAYEIKWRDTDGNSGTFSVAGGETTYPHPFLTNGVEVFYTLTATVSGKPSYATQEVSAIPGIGVVISFVEQKFNGSNRNNFDGWVGMGIRVGAADLSVVSLGRWFFPGDPNVMPPLPRNTATHEVKIVDRGTGIDVLAASVDVDISAADPTAPGFDGFVYATLQPDPITLLRNGEYYIVSREVNSGDVFLNADTRITITNATDATLQYSVYGDVAGAYAEAASTTNVYGPVNFLYQVMPP